MLTAPSLYIRPYERNKSRTTEWDFFYKTLYGRILGKFFSNLRFPVSVSACNFIIFMFQTKVVERNVPNILCPIHFICKSCSLCDH
jgi:hypothetical protein